MLNGKILGASVIALSWMLAGCPGGTTTTDGGTTDGGSAADAGDGGTAATIASRLGGEAGIKVVIADFIGRVIKDVKINAYFLNSDLQAARLNDCLVKQVWAATGGAAMYPATNDTDAAGCRGMKKAHTGLNISEAEFNALNQHLLDAITAKAPNSTADDKATIKTVLEGMKGDIVEAKDTLYRRAGGKEGITKVIMEFETNVLGDATLAPFFSNLTGSRPATMTSSLGVDRLTACLVRQVCEVAEGPCKYATANALETALLTGPNKTLQDCRTMEMVHDRVMNPNVAGTTMRDITIDDFNKLVGHFAASTTFKTLTTADQMAVGGVLGGLCKKIVVAMPNTCP